MSSVGTTGSGTAQRYFCHQCNRTVSITPSADGDLSCPICHSGFVEELEYSPSPSPNPFFPFQPIDPFFPSSAGLPFFSVATAAAGGGGSSPASIDLRNHGDLAGFLGGESSIFRSTPSPGGGSGPEPFSPLSFLQNYIQSLIAGGSNIQVVLEGSGGPIMSGNLGDYFVGPGLEQLIQQIAENDPNRYGTPPASKSAIEALPTITIREKMLLADDGAQCAVCKDVFELGAEATQIPCKHIYHKDCIIPWLELHNSCPVCRYELPTDDPDYEQRAREGHVPAQVSQPAGATSGSFGSSGSGGSEPNSPGTRTVERRFRISLPWPFRTSGSQAEASNAGDGSNGGSRIGGRDGTFGGNSGSHGGSEHQTRQEDLD